MQHHSCLNQKTLNHRINTDIIHFLSDEQLAALIQDIPMRPLLAGREGIRISLAGAQEKASLFYKDPLFYIPINGTPSNFILKPGMAHYQYPIENECFCMMLAKAVDLNVPPVKIVQKDTQKALLIKRYDRILDKDVPKRLHQEDFCQAMGLSQKLAMKIGDENRPEWIMGRHWKQFAEEIKVSHPVLKKRLLDFCLKVIGKIDGAHADFVKIYQKNILLEDIITAIKKRANKTLKQFD